uniref:ankyrin repeat-containing protein At3g12360-like n=1 Tax=Fragaria vesca subsp. vesca TaxID=101020 RepID=UPI0005CB77B2|nr:PREDICTED: ankyrin repeat-containing protein At3g12360-like [Fragaria vesca subsp. vesca]
MYVCIRNIVVNNDRATYCMYMKLTDYFKSCCTGWIWNVPAMFQGSIMENFCKIFGISRIYEMKVNHFRVHEILVCMCKVLTREKKKELWEDNKQAEFVEAAMFQAAERGLVEFLTEILKVNPYLAQIKNKKGQNLFQVAVECRQAEVFNLIHGFNQDNRKACMSMKDGDDNNMLHMMGISSPSSQTNRIRGAALQMQNELQWFKELERMASPEDLEAENDTLDMTPREFFSKNHTELVKEGEKSMKDTATSCTVVGALIVTMMFAVAFTLPTPLKDNSTPPLLYRRAFRVFIIADAISLFTSTTSVVLFLGILTSRYAEDDFLSSLPRKMILGLLTLFLSVAAMVIVFASALFIILPSDTWIALPTTLLAGIPIASFIWMQFPFLVEIFYSTYIRRLFDKKVHVKLNVGKLVR